MKFVYRAFGRQCADLLLAGYGEGRPQRSRKLDVVEESAGASTEWVVGMEGKYIPNGREPLILAALLKLLLQRPTLATRLEFGLDELVEELGWEDGLAARKTIDRVIAGYASLFYYKRHRRKRDGVQGGPYSLITAYIRGSDRGSGDEALTRIYSYVEFEPRFVEGLKKGQVLLADIYFGPFYPKYSS